MAQLIVCKYYRINKNMKIFQASIKVLLLTMMINVKLNLINFLRIQAK